MGKEAFAESIYFNLEVIIIYFTCIMVQISSETKSTFYKLVGNGGDVLGKKVCGEADKPHYYAGCD